MEHKMNIVNITTKITNGTICRVTPWLVVSKIEVVSNRAGEYKKP